MDRAISPDSLPGSEKSFESWGQVNCRLLRYISPYISGRVLDAGCARGGYTEALLVRHDQVYGCDLLYWPEWKAISGARFCQADITNLPFADRSFATVLSFNTLEHVQPVEASLYELRRVCRERLILSVPNCQRFPEMAWAGLSFHHWVDRSHVHFFQAEGLREILTENGFEVELLEPFGSVRPEVLFLRSMGIPMVAARGIAWGLQKIPWRKRYSPLLLAIARVMR